MTRLDSIDPNLTISFRKSPYSKQRMAAIEACKIAAAASALDQALLDRCASRFVEDASPDLPLISQLEGLSAQFDDE